MAELPPKAGIFSIKSTSAPPKRASSAAVRPAKPEPTTMMS